MTDYFVSALRSPVAAPAGAAKPLRDQLLAGHNDGVRFLFDLDFSWCYPGGASSGRPAAGAPAAGQAIHDIAERANGSYLRQGSTPVANYAGGGFDFSPITKNPFGVKGPTDAWDTIHSAPNRYFLWVGYYRLPSEADFNSSNSNIDLFGNTPNNGTYITNIDPLALFQIQPASQKLLVIRRQIAVGASPANASLLELAPTSDHFGTMCQIAYWRNESGQGFRVKSVDSELVSTASVGAETALDFSGLGPVWGVPITPDNGPLEAGYLNATNYRLYRGWLEDLGMSGRNPLAVLNADWQRVQSRIAASAAANGGTSLIFV